MRELDIGEVSKRAGVPPSTLRFYEQRGLIAAVGGRGLRRQFDTGVLKRLALIALGRAAGFSLQEIALMFAPDGRPRIDRRILASKAQELDRTIARRSDACCESRAVSPRLNARNSGGSIARRPAHSVHRADCGWTPGMSSERDCSPVPP
jgi:DNA-binding transcriptional MerR regulator